MEPLFYDLATKVITGDASNTEQDQLQQLLVDRPELEAEYESLRSAWDQSQEADLQTFASEDWHKVQARLKATSKPEPKGISMNRWISIAASLSLILAASFIIWNSMQWEHVRATAGNMEIQLPDKSVVTLREGSSLSYHYRFAENRKVELEGEAFFEVAKDPFHPFEITSGKTQVQVLGTAFNVNTVPGNGTEVHVKEGRVEFKAGEARLVLKAGEAARFSESNNSIESLSFGSGNHTMWPENKLEFSNQQLQTVFNDLEHYFGIEIKANGANLACGYTGKFADPDLESVLKTLERTLALEFEKQGSNTFILKSGGCQ